MFHLSGYYSSVNPAGVLTALAPIADQIVTTINNDVRVPNTVNNVGGAIALINDASAARAQLQSPSLRNVLNPDIEPIITGATFGSVLPIFLHGNSPMPLDVDEGLDFFAQSAPAGAVDHFGFVFLTDGKFAPVSGQIYTLRTTAAAAGTKGKWDFEQLTMGQVLPVGSYQVVGMRARGATLVAARLVFIGGIFRPGVIAVAGVADIGSEQFRYGNVGVYGQFDSTTPPAVELLDNGAETVEILLDLIKVK